MTKPTGKKLAGEKLARKKPAGPTGAGGTPPRKKAGNAASKTARKTASKTASKPTSKVTNPGKVILRGHLEVAKDQVAAVTEALVLHSELTRNEPGCLMFEVTPDYNSYGRFLVYEEFTNIAAFHAHQKRIIGTKWEAATATAQRFYEVIGLDGKTDK